MVCQQEGIIGTTTAGSGFDQGVPIGAFHLKLQFQRGHHLLCYTVLKFKDIIQCTLVTIRPKCPAISDLIQVDADTHSIATALHTATQYRIDTQLLTHGLQVGVLILVAETGNLGGNYQVIYLGQTVNQFSGYAIAEVFIIRIQIEIQQGQYGN